MSKDRQWNLIANNEFWKITEKVGQIVIWSILLGLNKWAYENGLLRKCAPVKKRWLYV